MRKSNFSETQIFAQLLAGAGLAADENGGVAARHLQTGTTLARLQPEARQRRRGDGIPCDLSGS